MIIPDALLGEIRRELEAVYPSEGCGLLLGTLGEEQVRVVSRRPVENRRTGGAASSRYLITADEVQAATKAAQADDLEIIGVYHSHPDAPARPSAYDRTHAWPWYRYLIVSVFDGRAAAAALWRLRDDRTGFEREALCVTASIEPRSEGSRI